jgi:hypothetical protein
VIDIVAAMESAVAGHRPDAAEAGQCTLGAAIVWRAVDRAAAAGADPATAAEAGLQAGAGYLRLASELQRSAGMTGLNACVDRLVNELRGRAARARSSCVSAV